MRENYTLTRLYIDAALTQDADISLSKQQAHYLGTVLRKGQGDALRVFNGGGGEWRAEITALSRKGAMIRAIEQLRAPKAAPDIWLCFAPVRKHRNSFIIEKATELGAAELHPILTQRTQFSRLNIDKARLQAIEAAEQTERLDVPHIHDVARSGIEAYLAAWTPSRRLIFADEAGDAQPVMTALQNMPRGPAAVLIGPEGGFSAEERDVLRAQDYVTPVSLGPRILRADTAALSVLTLWQAALGDWS